MVAEKLGGAGCGETDVTEAVLYPILPKNKNAIVIDPSICLEKGFRYNIQIDFRSNTGDGQTLIDSVSNFVTVVWAWGQINIFLIVRSDSCYSPEVTLFHGGWCHYTTYFFKLLIRAGLLHY